MNIQPFVYHLAEAENWASIQRHGLFSARVLLERAGIDAAIRAAVVQRHRPQRIILPNGLVIRDQKPMPPAALERCLVELSAAEWYALMNSNIFFWFDIDRLNRQRGACGGSAQVVLKIAADRLLARHAARSALTPINTGNARRKPALRGTATFVPYKVWAETGWLSEARALGTRPRVRSHRPVELAVAYSVPDIMDFAVSVRSLAPGRLYPVDDDGSRSKNEISNMHFNRTGDKEA
jgi:hypothetical protein